MKTKILIVLIACIVLTTSALKSQTNTNLVEYNNQILYHYTLLDNYLSYFVNSIYGMNSSESELIETYNFLKKICKYNGEALRSIKPIPTDDCFYKSIVSFYDLANNIINNEYQQIIDMYSQDWKDDFFQKIMNLEETSTKKIIDGENNVINCQEKFAAKNKLNLQK